MHNTPIVRQNVCCNMQTLYSQLTKLADKLYFNFISKIINMFNQPRITQHHMKLMLLERKCTLDTCLFLKRNMSSLYFLNVFDF